MTSPDLPVAGELYRLRYFPTLNGQPVDVTSVDRVQLFLSAARDGVPVLTVVGPAERVALGSYAFAATAMPAAGTYPAVVTFATGATVRTDRDDVVVVYGYGGGLGDGGSGRLLSVADVRQLLRGNADGPVEGEPYDGGRFVPDSRLLQYARVADEIVESVVGPLGEPPYRATWLEAASIIVVHLWDRYTGAVPEPLGAGSDDDGAAGRGFAIPRAALELLKVSLTARQDSHARGAFPLPERYPDPSVGYGPRGEFPAVSTSAWGGW